MNIKGLSDLDALLKQLPEKLERNVMRSALRAGAKHMAEKVKSNIPVAKPNEVNVDKYGGYEGALRDSVRIGTRSKRGVVTAYVRAGGNSKGKSADTYYAQWVEYGTTRHNIDSKHGYLKINGRRVKAPVSHPGAKPHPFMRPAVDSESENSVVVIGNTVKERLSTKHGLDTADIQVGDE